MVNTGNEINKGQRNPMLRRNRDVGFGGIAFTVLLEIDLVVAQDEISLWRAHGRSLNSSSIVEMVWSGYVDELMREK